MKPLFHPEIQDIKVEAILHALSDPVRVAIFAELQDSCRSQICAEFLNISDKPTNKSTLSRHLNVLREAGLIKSERCGVEMHNRSRCLEVDERFPGLLLQILNAYMIQLKPEKVKLKKKSTQKV